MATWYVYQNNVRTGPVSEDQLSGMGLTPATPVWREGMEQWQPAGQVPELSFLFEAPAGEGSSFTTTPLPRPEQRLMPEPDSISTHPAERNIRARKAVSNIRMPPAHPIHPQVLTYPPPARTRPQPESRHTPWFLRCAVFLSRQNRSRDTDYRALIRHLWYPESADIRTGHCHAHNVSGTV